MSSASDFIIENGILKKYVGPGGDVVIPEGVMSIGDGAFNRCSSIASVTIPEGVTNIGKCAFSGCSDLMSVTIPEGVKSIGFQAFAGCNRLTDITVPESVTEIEAWAYKACPGLADENGFVIIKGILLDFLGTTASVTIPEGVTIIGFMAFADCSTLTEVIIPKSMISIGDSAFWRCKNLKHVVISDSVTSIGDSAFYGCELAYITIPESVTHIGNDAFRGCKGVAITLYDGLEIPKTALDYLDCEITCQIWTPEITKLAKRSHIQRINVKDFSSIPTNLRLPALLGAISKRKEEFDGEQAKLYSNYAKKNASKLFAPALAHPELLRYLCAQKAITAKDIDLYMQEAGKRKDPELTALLLDYQNALGWGSVQKARKRKEQQDDRINEQQFERRVSRQDNEGVKGLRFVITGQLSEIWTSRNEIKTYLTALGARLDDNVTGQTDYLVTNDKKSGSQKNKTTQRYGVEVISEKQFNLMIGKRFAPAETIHVPSWITVIASGAFSGMKKLKEVILTDSVNEIQREAFFDCRSLERIIIHEGVRSIGESAFAGCQNLLCLTIPQSVASIDKLAFHNCTGLKELTMSNSLPRIGDRAFLGCKGLADENGFVIIGRELMDYFGTKKEVVIPDKVRTIGISAFAFAKKMEKVIVPEGVTRIEAAFHNCYTLKTAVLPRSLTTINAYAFYRDMVDDRYHITIHAPAGSYAEQYAKENNIPFVAE